MASRMTFAVCLCSAACLLTGTGARADDEFPPSWRGNPGSTYQQWAFSTNDASDVAPESENNPYGNPLATVNVGMYGSGWYNTNPGVYGAKQGWWDVGEGSIVLDIPNTSNTGPGTFKEIWVQVTYWLDINAAPTVSIDLPGATKTDEQSVKILNGPTGGAWWLDQSKWYVEPNPLSETITITGSPTAGSQIDQIVVDTICFAGTLCAPDLDGDNDVDGFDFTTFSLCYNGSLKPLNSGCANVNADLDGDDDVDGFDFTTFSLCYNGSLRPPQSGCPCVGGS